MGIATTLIASIGSLLSGSAGGTKEHSFPTRCRINHALAPGASPQYWDIDYETIANIALRSQRIVLVDRINAFLAGSPMAGLGECMMANAERTGVWVMLCPAQAYAESSLGRCNLYPYQAWGMYGVRPVSWEDGVRRYFDNIVAHWGQVRNCHELVNPNYCEPPEPYNTNVQKLAESI